MVSRAKRKLKHLAALISYSQTKNDVTSSFVSYAALVSLYI